MEPKILYYLAKFSDCLCPHLITYETDSTWGVCKDTKWNRKILAEHASSHHLNSKAVIKRVNGGNKPNGKWTTDRDVALAYLKKNLREQVERLVTLAARADAIEEMDEAAMSRTGVFGK